MVYAKKAETPRDTSRHSGRTKERPTNSIVIVDVNTRTVFGYEALIRGPVESSLHTAPALFSAAGEFDLIFELDCLCRASGLRGAVDLPEGTKLFLNQIITH